MQPCGCPLVHAKTLMLFLIAMCPPRCRVSASIAACAGRIAPAATGSMGLRIRVRLGGSDTHTQHCATTLTAAAPRAQVYSAGLTGSGVC